MFETLKHLALYFYIIHTEDLLSLIQLSFPGNQSETKLFWSVDRGLSVLKKINKDKDFQKLKKTIKSMI